MMTFRFHLLKRVGRTYATLREQAKKLSPMDLYEPKFEDNRIFPEYESINIRVQGHDYGSLEKFQSYVHKWSKKFGFKILDSYAVAAQSERVVTFKPGSTVIDSELELNTYDRWIRLSNVPAIHLPIFSTLLHTHAPPGVQITIKEHCKEDENYRYIPDLQLKQKQEELRALDNLES